MTIQDSQPALNILQDSIKSIQEQPELDVIKNVASTLQATSEYRQELKQKLQNRVKGTVIAVSTSGHSKVET